MTRPGTGANAGDTGDDGSNWEAQRDLERTLDPYWAMHSPDKFKLNMQKFGGAAETEHVMLVGMDPGKYRLPQGFLAERVKRTQIVTDGERRLIGSNPFANKSSLDVVERAGVYEQERLKITNPARRLNSDIQVHNAMIQHSGLLSEHDYMKPFVQLQERGGLEVQRARGAVELAAVIKKEAQAELKGATGRIKEIEKLAKKIVDLKPPTSKGKVEIAGTPRARGRLDKAKRRETQALRDYVAEKYNMLSTQASTRRLYAGDMATVIERIMVNKHVLDEEYEERNRRDRDAVGSIPNEVLLKRDRDLKKQRILWRDVEEEVGVSDSRVDVHSRLSEDAKGGLDDHSKRLADYRFIVRDELANKAMFNFIATVSQTHGIDTANQLDDARLRGLTEDLSNPSAAEIIARLQTVSWYLRRQGRTVLESSMKAMIDRKAQELERMKRDEEDKNRQ